MVPGIRHTFVLVRDLLAIKFANRRRASSGCSERADEESEDAESIAEVCSHTDSISTEIHAGASRFKLCEGAASKVLIGDSCNSLSTSPDTLEMKRLWNECRELRLQQESKKRTDQKLIWRDSKGVVSDRHTTTDAPDNTVHVRTKRNLSELERRADILTSTVIVAKEDVIDSTPACPGWVKPCSSGLSNSLPIVTFRQVGEGFVELKLANNDQRLYREWRSPELRKFAANSDSGLLNRATLQPTKTVSLSAIDDKKEDVVVQAEGLIPRRPASPGRTSESINNCRRKAVIQCTKKEVAGEAEQITVAP